MVYLNIQYMRLMVDKKHGTCEAKIRTNTACPAELIDQVVGPEKKSLEISTATSLRVSLMNVHMQTFTNTSGKSQ